MSDDWEDWENDEIVPLNQEQLKMLEERKLVEESDNLLAKDLFSNEEDLVYEELIKKENHIKVKKEKPKNKISNQKQNEERLKELSKKNKENKAILEIKKEIFGEAEHYDEYEDYEDKFY